MKEKVFVIHEILCVSFTGFLWLWLFGELILREVVVVVVVAVADRDEVRRRCCETSFGFCSLLIQYDIYDKTNTRYSPMVEPSYRMNIHMQ